MNADQVNVDVHTLTGAYAVDALDDLQRRQFEAHVGVCPDCAREVDELRATAARLAVTVGAHPPEWLKQRVLDQIAITRQDAPITPRSGGTAVRLRGQWTNRLSAIAAAVSLVAAVGLGVVAWHGQRELGSAQTQLAQAQARYEPVAAVLAAPDARATTAAGVVGGTATVVVSHELNRVVLTVAGMPRPPAGHAYQAWLLSAGGARSAGVLAAGARATGAPLVTGGLGGVTKIGVTVEPAGGSRQPTTTPVMLFDLPA